MAVGLSYTATFHADLAREVGVAAAVLYNLLVWFSQGDVVKDYDKDGWFYLTAATFEEHTAYNRNTFTSAAKKLEEVGLIERKRAYIKGTSVSSSHFRIKVYNWETQRTNIVHSDVPMSVHSYNNSNKYSNKSKKSHSDFCAPVNSPIVASMEEEPPTPPPSPFDEQTKPAAPTSIRPDKDPVNAERKRKYAVANAVRKTLGLSGSATGAFKDRVGAWLDAGYTEDDIIEAFKMMDNASDQYYREANPLTRLSQTCMDWYAMQKKKPQSTGQGDVSGYDFPPLTITSEDILGE